MAQTPRECGGMPGSGTTLKRPPHDCGTRFFFGGALHWRAHLQEMFAAKRTGAALFAHRVRGRYAHQHSAWYAARTSRPLRGGGG